MTSISPPNTIPRALAEGSLARGIEFIVVGESKSLADFSLDGCRFLAAGPASIPQSLRRRYEALVGLGLLPEPELALLDCWLGDLDAVTPRGPAPAS